MKTPSIALLNSLGFENDEQRVAYAAWVLWALSGTAKKVIVTPAVRANPRAVPPIVASPEVSAPEIKAIPGMAGAIEIQRSTSEFRIIAKFPQPLSRLALGAELRLTDVGEIVPNSVSVNNWLDTKASDTPTTSTTPEPATLEQYFAKYAQALLDSYHPSIGTYQDRLGDIPVQVFDIRIPTRNEYNWSIPSLQLDKLGMQPLPEPDPE